MSSDISTEQAIQAAGATKGPRITPADIEAEIVRESYFTAADALAAVFDGRANAPDSLKTLTFCVLILRNGFTVTGESACASPENFNAEIGCRIARENAVAKVWPLMGYRLRDQLANGSAGFTAHDMATAAADGFRDGQKAAGGAA